MDGIIKVLIKSLPSAISLSICLTLAACSSGNPSVAPQSGSNLGGGVGGNQTPIITDRTTDGGSIDDPGDGHQGDVGFVGTPAKLEVTPASYDFGIQSINSFTYATFTVRNIGQQQAHAINADGLSGPYNFRNGSYPGFRGTCGSTLEPGVSCTIVLAFSPSALGRYQLSTFKVSYDQGNVGIPLDASVSDIATLRFANIVDDNDYWDFGAQAYGTTTSKTIHVQYFGARPATGVTFSGLTSPYSIVSNTCSDSVSADCDLVVRFGANVVGSFQQKLKVTYNNSSYAAEDNHIFTGSISSLVTPGTIGISNANFGTLLVGNSLDQTLLVFKGGTLPATAISASSNNAAFSFKGGSYPGTGGTCGTTITANCTIVVTFSPSSAVSYSGSLSFSFNNGQSTTSTSNSMSGRGGNAALLTLAPATNPVDFGTHPVGFSSYASLTLSNASTSVAATSIAISIPTGPFANLGGCGATLNPGASCNFTVRFKPTSAGTAMAPLTISFFDGAQSQSGPSRDLTGTATSAAVLSPYVATFDFGSVMVNSTKTVALTILYYGGQPAVVTSTTGINAPFAYPTGNFSGGGSCGASISSNCTVQVSFTPTAVQSYSTSFEINYDDGSGTPRTIRIVLNGRGVNLNAAILRFAQAPAYDFGNVAVGVKKTVSLTINRTGDFSATSVSASGLSAPISFEGGSYPGWGGSCASNISAASCTIAVSFLPTAEGAFSKTVSISYYDGFAAQSLSLPITGTGVNVASLSATAGNLPSVALGGTSEVSIRVTNTGVRQADGLFVTASPHAPFTVLANDCSNQLPSGGNCNILVQFVGSRPGNFNDSIIFSYLNGLGTITLNIGLNASSTVPVLSATNGYFSCARNNVGQLKCWGQNNYGQLGLGDTNNRLSSSGLPAVNLGTNRYPVAIALGFFHACAILDDDSLKCWGSNTYGQLGVGIATPNLGASGGEMGDSMPLVNLGTGKTAVALSLGYSHSCALLNDGKVKCWGQNQEGQLGLGDTVSRGLSAADMGNNLGEVDLGSRNVVQISASTSHTCARLDNNTVKCWGNNFFGQLGLGDIRNRGVNVADMGNNLPAVSLGTGRTARSITTGGAFTCAVLDNSQVKCWGRNEEGILGKQYAQDQEGNVGLASDAANYPLALRGLGTGPNQMGDALPFITLGTGRTVVSLSAGDSSSCALLDNAAVKCWGQNQYGQLGLGDAASRGVLDTDMGNSLVAVSLSSTVTPISVSSGNFSNCALFSDASVKCWGSNRYGNLGLGDTINRGDQAGQMGNALPFLSF
jgi:alpha-tubulin suppressor-like RCC1 family protein